MPTSILHMKSIADTICSNFTKLRY